MKVVIDTNVLMSRFISPHGKSAQIFERWEFAEFTLLSSQPILIEYKEVLFSQKLRQHHHLSPTEMNEAIAQLETQTEQVEAEGVLTGISSDPDDDKFVECALLGGAEFIISGDHHLLNLETFEGIEILRPSAFLSVLDLA